MTELVAFLKARLDEDAQRARDNAGDERHQQWAMNESADYNEGFIVGDALWHLRDIEAKRRILDGFEDPGVPGPWGGCGDDCEYKAVAWAIGHLAAVYAGHPDYRTEWEL